jgi:hypothetical protein
LSGLVLSYVSGFILYPSQLAADTQPLTDTCGMRLIMFTDLESNISKFPTRCRSLLVWITGFVLRYSNSYLLGYTGSGACRIKVFLVLTIQQ